MDSRSDGGKRQPAATFWAANTQGDTMPGAIGDADGIDLNTADESELENIGGLGRERAGRIVQARPLKNWDDVRKIEGFSETLVNDLRQAGATVGGNRGEQAA